MSAERIQQKRTRGWRKPQGAVSVVRPHRWGNPHTVAEHGAQRAVGLFEADLVEGRLPYTTDVVQKELGSRPLMCWCPVGSPCHGDVLLRIANSEEAA
ncbi:DUF4326 domain-containing protein [Streptomyces sp. NPDC050535]|uniref:DUF4326 domain-containing protein n=1 Tax=Streptomyces sp. NPDC050535 TaxID=3365626 RepID=UPI0037BDB3EF